MMLATAERRDRSTPALADDAADVARVLGGDDAAFRAIFDRHAAAVHRYLRDQLRDDAAAEEATQEVFVRAHRQLDRLREPERLQSWLFGIARYVHLEQRRRQKRARDSASQAVQRGELAAQPPESAPSPEELVLGEEADRVLADALAHLDDEHRAALILRLDHGWSYADIAEHLGWPLHKVKNQIHRGRMRLRAHLASYLGGRS